MITFRMFIIKGKSMSEDLKTKLSLLNNLIESKTNAVNAHIESLKKLEGYSFAGREITAKFNSYLTQQASEIQTLAVSQKISQEIASVALTILENFKKIVKETEEESMKIFFVKQGDGDAIHFGFDCEVDPAILCEFLNPVHKFPHFVWRVCVVETLHRHDVAGGNECLQCLAADGLCWRTLFSESRKGLL